MANTIKTSGEDGVALQVTKPARAAGLVEENSEGEPTMLADIRAFSFDYLLLVVDLEIATQHTTELVVTAAKDTESIYRAMDASVQRSGNGYQIQLPPAADAGFAIDDRAPCRPADGILVITNDNGTAAGTDAARLARDLATIRADQRE
jgi:hypothetical protein